KLAPATPKKRPHVKVLPAIPAIRESREKSLLEFVESFEDGEGDIDMAHAEILDVLAPGPSRPRGRDNLTMLQVDDTCIDLTHLGMGIVPLDDQVIMPIPGISDDMHDHGVEIEPADEQVEMVLDMEGVGTDDP